MKRLKWAGSPLRSCAFGIVALFLSVGAGAATLATDVTISTDATSPVSSVATPAFSTTVPNELLLAFISSDAATAGVTVTGVTGGGLTWALVRRTNVQLGTAEIWRAFAPNPISATTVRAALSQTTGASITVVSFTGADTTGISGSGAIGATASANANPGAPSASLVTQRDGSWVWGVGNDWDNAIARTVPSNQAMVHQYLAGSGDTWWVQRTNSPTVSTGTSVTINDTAPSTDRYNLTLVEVLPSQGAGGPPTYSISGTITPATLGNGTLLTLGGDAIRSTTANASGIYSFTGLANGSYTVTPSKTATTFVPTSRSVDVTDSNVPSIDFTATSTGPTLNYPDLMDIISPSAFSIASNASLRLFQYTHDTFNGGSGPLVIQPAYHPTSGNYQGTQYIYSRVGGAWQLMQQIPVPGAFVFDPDHGHFHFPFATYGLYGVADDGGVGDPVALSDKTGFCIDDSFIYDTSLPNAGTFPSFGSCADPTSLRGLDVGAVDEYDRTDDGQSISILGVPDGTYWLKAVVDPFNYLVESNENNNETDVELTITGNNVQVLQTVIPVLPPLPSIVLTAPADGAVVSGTVNLVASTPATTGVQFLVDGLPVGGIVTDPSYVFPWNSTTVPNGTHWLAVQTTDSHLRTNASTITVVTVSNGQVGDTTPPTVQITTPEPGDTVSATVTIGAAAQDQSPVNSLQFYVDGFAFGAPLTASPYMISWNTTAFPNGLHSISASATDGVGLVGTSAAVTVMVDNSHPPELIGKDVDLSTNGTGVITTPPFSTATANDLLIAFVAYDGPAAPQTATVSGAGLTWTLLKRSNVQRGTSEIWSARAGGVLTNVTVSCQPGTAGYSGMLSMTAFTHAASTGVVGQASAPTGPPDIYLPGIMAGSWVFAVGNDWDRATPRTPVAGQVVVHQWVNTSSGDTYWVQSTDAPSTAFALVDIHDTAPTADQWNYAAVEIVATRQSGLLSAPVGAPPRAVSLSGAFPNPSTGGVELWLTLPREDDVALSILDVQGREVWRAPAVRRGQGRQALAWDGRSASGPVRSGVYLGCVRVGQRSFTRRFAIVR